MSGPADANKTGRNLYDPFAADAYGRPIATFRVVPNFEAFNMDATNEYSVYLGIDVGGRVDKGFDLCFLGFANGNVADIEFRRCPYPLALPATDQLRAPLAAGDVGQVARMTHPAAAEVAAALWKVVAKQPLSGAFIDSPSGFSRNQRGHGRATEKVGYGRVWFQQTPSVAANREHLSDWGWLVYGMVAYTAFLYSGMEFSETEWRSALQHGLYSPTSRLQDLAVRECFPTASVAVFRADQARCSHVQQLLSAHRHRGEVVAVHAYLQQGVAGVKRRNPVYDRADALVAALSSLPYALPQVYREVERLPRPTRKWHANPGDDFLEGRIAVVE